MDDTAAEMHGDIHAVVTGAGFRFAALEPLGIQSGAFTLSLVEVEHG